MFGIDDAISVGLKILDKVIPDPAAKAEAQTKLLELQMQGQIKLEELGIQDLRIAAGDRDSARKMQIAALANDDKFSKRFVYFFTIFWSLCSAMYIGFITFGTIPEHNIRFADTILGFILGTAVASMFSYFYGSTSSSKSKDATIHNMTNL